MTNTTSAAIHLQYVIDNWPHLADMLTTRHAATWPPAMGIQHILNGADDSADPEEEQRARALARLAERADSGYTLGASPAPVRLQIVDTMRTVTADLVYLTDVLSQEVQRPPMKHAPTHWPHADRVKRDLMADRDSADPRRWHRRHARTAPSAAAWLLGRVDRAPGPFLPLGPTQLRRIDTAARHAQEQIEQALDGVQQVQRVERPCPLCAGQLVVASGDGELPVVTCFGCRQTWTLPLLAVA
jgi:hypothetical protein